jgi:uncharacterized membrane protein YagU involved in acid resistance
MGQPIPILVLNMTEATKFSDITVGHVLKFLLTVLACAYVGISMWLGQMFGLFIIARIFHVHYNAFGVPALDRMAEGVLLIFPPLLTTFPFIALIWEQSYGKKPD